MQKVKKRGGLNREGGEVYKNTKMMKKQILSRHCCGKVKCTT